MLQTLTVQPDRTCKQCVKTDVCKYYEHLEKLVADLPYHTEDGNPNDMYVVLANCCPFFQRKKFKSLLEQQKEIK